MIKRKIMRFLAGAMCSIMLVTSEGMSGLAYAASVPEEVAAEQEGLAEETSSEFSGDETGEGNTGEEDTDREESSESGGEEITTEAVTASSEEVDSEEESTPEGDILEEDTSEENTLEWDTLTEEEVTETEIFSEEETDGFLEEESLTLEADEQTGDTEQIVVECTIENAYQFGGAPSVSEEIGVPADSASNEADDAAIVAYLYQEMKKRNPSIDVSSYNIPASQTNAGWTSEKARNLVGAVLNEHPDLYYVSGSYGFSFGSDGSGGYKVTTLIFTYTDGLDDTAFENAVNKALETIAGVTDDVQKVILLHDYLAVNCEYDYENYLAGKVPSTSHSAYGVFVNRTAVCQGYALAYKYLLNRAGIDCYMVTSDSMNHAWNLVKLGGNYYQVDVTWDDPTWDLVGRAAHTYMLRSDAAFKSVGSNPHRDWSVTSGSGVVNYEATDTTYDSAFWLDSNSPLILIDGEWYFAAYDATSYTCSIQKRTLADTEGTAICSFDHWPSWGAGSSLWPGAYSGLSLINGRLYYNDKAKIYSIKPDGTDQKTEFTADTTNGYIYGSAYCQGKIYYSLHQGPNFDAKEEVLTADISLGTGGEGGGEIEEPAEATDFEIIDEDGNILKKDEGGKYEQITMVVGEQKMFGIKLLPEGSAVSTSPIWSSHTSRLSARDGILVANSASEDPVTVTVTLGSMQKEFQVLIREATAGDKGMQINDVVINSTGIGTVSKIDDKTFDVNIDKDASLTLSYTGETEGVSVYYNLRGSMTYDEGSQRLIGGSRYSLDSCKPIPVRHDMAFQVAVVTGDTRQQQLVEGIYTINFHVCNSDFEITRSVRTIPGADDVELAAIRLPETAKIEDIEWTSGDTNIVSIGDKTENGVMIKIGKSVGTVQVTARVKDHKGKYVYAVCSVRVTKTVPTPSVSSNDAGWADVENDEGDVVDGYWVIDNGGRITLAVKGVSDVEIFYTLDGSDPTENSNRYVGPITISKAVTIKAFARKAGYEDSGIMEERFKIGTSKLAISQTSLTVEQGKEKEITVKTVPTGTSKSDVAWSSSDPGVADVEVREQIGHRKDEEGEDEEYVIREYMVIAAHGEGKCTITASVTDYAGRTVTAECIVIVPRKVSEPVFTPNYGTGITMSEWKKVHTGVYDDEGNEEIEEVEVQWVIVDKGGTIEIIPADGETSEDIIYYTTDGSKPTTSSKKYTGPIKITKKCTVKAIAAHTGCTSSDVVEMRYVPYDTSMTLSKTSMSMAAGKKQEISVKKWPTGPVEDRPSISWSSANDKVATVGTEIEYKDVTVGYEDDVDENDKPIKVPIIETREIEHTFIYGVGSGKTQIIASYTDYAGNSREAVCNVTVTGKLEITPAITVTEEETAVLSIKKNQTGVSKEDITWTSDNPLAGVIYDEEDGQFKVNAGRMTDTSGPVKVVVTASVTIEGDGEDAENIEVEACCEVTVVPKSYTVTFIGWNGKTAKEEQVYRDQDATPPLTETMNTATPKGWMFKEWNEPDTAWKKVTADTEIIAKYEKQTYTIQYEVGDKGTNPSDNPATYTVDLIDVSGNSSDRGNLLVLKDAVSTDAAYVFAGWYKDSGYAGSPTTEIPKGSTGDLILYAKWIPKNDGMWVVPIPDQTYTGKALKPEVIVYDGTKPLTLGVDYTVQYKNNTKANLGSTDAEKKKRPTVIVKGKGNYTGSASVEFTILPKDISDSTQEDIFTADDLYMAYNGKILKPAPILKRNGKKLNNKTEYGIKEIKQVIVKEDGTEEDGPTVTECKEVGKYKIIIEGKGNYTGIRTISLTITEKTLMSKVSIGKIADIEWTGRAVDPSKVDPKLTYKKTTTLIKDIDYTVTYDTSAVDIGSYEVRFTGKGDYVGEVVKTFKIKGKTIKASNIKISGMQNKDYDGTPQTQNLTVSYGSGKNAAAMIEGRDYTLTYLNNTNAGKKATVVIQGIGGYSGTVKKTFTVKAYSLKAGYDKDEVRVALAQEGPVYHEKGGVKPEVVVYCGERELAEGTDYTLKYKNNGKAARTGDKKPPTVTVTGKGNFSGSVNLTFSIVPQDISLCSIAANDVMANAVSTKNPDGLTGAGKYKSTPVLTDKNGKKLAAGTDYKKQYVYTDENGNVIGSKDKIAAGSILTVTVTGTGSYQGEISVSYRVLSAKKSVTSAKVSIKPEVKKNYSGEPVTISKDDLIVKIGNEELKASDYTIVSYSNNLKKGTATVTIQGIGEYGGTKTIKFSIRPKTVSWKESIANIF